MKRATLLLDAAGYHVERFEVPGDFVRAWNARRSGCLVMDASSPLRAENAGDERFQELMRSVPVVFLTANGDVPEALRAMTSHSVWYVDRPLDPHALLDAVKAALDRDAVDRAERLLRHDVDGRIASLTPREREVMDRVVAGHSNKGIAEKLGISFRTIEIHRARVMEKMNADSLSRLVRLAVRHSSERFEDW